MTMIKKNADTSAMKTLAKVNNVEIQIASNRQQLVPIKPICEALEIDWKSQFQKLKDDEILGATVVLNPTVGADGKNREMVCLPLKFIFGWLFTINPKNVKDEAREAVTRYRIECYNVLYTHFAMQADFLAAKQEATEEQFRKMDTVRSEFNQAKDKLAEARKEFNKIRELTFEEWGANKLQEGLRNEN